MKNIVVLTRNGDVPHVLARALGEGYRVAAASSLKDLEKKRKKPELIIFDISPPFEGSMQDCRRLKKNPRTRDIPVIALFTAAWEREKQKVFESTGAEYVLAKPFSIAEFREAVYSWV
jgi:CheY-like chemotaxis protein